jgi:signal transduction histidine kinase
VNPTKAALRELAREYAIALYGYLRDPGEGALSLAYELGRHAMPQGFGVLDMAAIHRGAIASILTPSKEKLDAAEDFFRELLSPFEMMFRGYSDANTELRRVNEVLLRERETVLAMNRELDAFSASVSHDLRAPLRAMAGFSAILDEEATGPLNTEQRDCVDRIRTNARLMKGLIDDLLELARVARGEVARVQVDLTALAHEVLARLKAADPTRDVEVLVEDSLVADADPGLLRVVIENLLGNAWKFTSKRPKAQITLGVVAKGPEPVYFVRDDGAGFDMTDAKKLFGPFQRLHSITEFEGTGIGLATVQRIIRRHRGRIWAESVPDHGATFYFTLEEQRAA